MFNFNQKRQKKRIYKRYKSKIIFELRPIRTHSLEHTHDR